jgi:RES domain-containing protein
MPVSVWRIAADTEGHGAEATGGRWNRRGTPVVYASTTRALACLETVVHLGSGSLPLNRYLVEIVVPDAAWENRATFDAALHVGWDAEPAGLVSLNWGTAWAVEGSTLLVELPSVVVPEESNILINPRHRGAAALRARKVRRWAYDARLR